MPSRTLLLWSLAALGSSTTQAFTTATIPMQNSRMVRPAVLHLTPGQASDLVQASKVVYRSNEEQDEAPNDLETEELLYEFAANTASSSCPKEEHEQQQQQQQHLLSMVRRLFSLPSYLRHPTETPINFFDDELGLEQQHAQLQQQNKLLLLHKKPTKRDVVYYPVVGFRYATVDDQGHCRPLCQVSHPSCVLHDSVESEPVYGWFHPSSSSSSTTTTTTTAASLSDDDDDDQAHEDDDKA
mmetsp:Transcript_15849/g.34742  ORF Transcript_15849/g.34742 Transcript_15849/m.34742 type:complete len:241 (-) Transcript_15849:278-1000(-)|eukprot:CAMPEP_0168737048 /NCGR_PEP_ID=MMETSP0724-20121128/10183_1 /TAXON_ID=265536 /ORGANISM="Amphiprora sp., Strain CCMP467" /LENGTH=240 /DNA_ID=CAMNT_0008784281 /DNA_START=149 /DNA_END=871 /DNA_ORIENTATION=-